MTPARIARTFQRFLQRAPFPHGPPGCPSAIQTIRRETDTVRGRSWIDLERSVRQLSSASLDLGREVAGELTEPVVTLARFVLGQIDDAIIARNPSLRGPRPSLGSNRPQDPQPIDRCVETAAAVQPRSLEARNLDDTQTRLRGAN